MQNKDAFLALVKAGLWEQEARLSSYGKVDLNEVLRMALEQSVLGMVTAGLDHVVDVKVPYETRLMFVGSVSKEEQRNMVMNRFVAELVGKMQFVGIKAVLVKGQGVAQCYEKPLWRSAGDIDLLFDEDNYGKAKSLLIPLSDFVDVEDVQAKHQGLKIKDLLVELHGKMPFAMSGRVDRVVGDVLKDTLSDRGIRIWNNAGTEIYLPKIDNDVIIVFTHLLHHFFIEGVGLRQICDWCRLLWTYRDEIDRGLLKERLGRMGLMSEWKAFASLAVNHLGMSEDAMPFYDKQYHRRGDRVLSHVLKSGNLGHNNNQKYRSKLSKPMANTVTFFRRIWDFAKFAFIFPVDSPKFFITYLFGKFKKNAV